MGLSARHLNQVRWSFLWIIAAAAWLAIVALHSAHGQEAAPATMDLQSHSPAPSTPPPVPPLEQGSPSPTPIPPSDVPELSTLDQAFKKSSLGKTADEFHERVEIRRLQNQVNAEPRIVSAKKAADSAHTDLEKRERLRDYYTIYYGRLRALASTEETRKAIDDEKAEHLKLLDQPRVRPEPGGTIPPPPKKEKKAKKPNKYGRTSH